MVRRLHPVLAVISNCYSEPKGRFPRVTHPCATRPEGLVRLACVRHAASVRSEPGSNSQVDVIAPCRTRSCNQAIRTKPNFGSRCLHFQTYMDTKDIQTSAYFKLPPRARRPPGAGAVAHMSLHLINNVKEPTDKFRRTIILPQFNPGRSLSVYDVATASVSPEFPAPPLL